MPRKYTRVPVKTRLISGGARSGSCLLWTRAIDRYGYGFIKIAGRMEHVHRVAYREFVGPIPEGHQIHHLCDINYAPGDVTYRRCFEATHLQPGTNQANMDHMVETGRSAAGDRSHQRQHPEQYRGAKNGAAKLTERDVLAILRAYASGGVTQRQLAAEYHVTFQAIWLIVHRKKWGHLDISNRHLVSEDADAVDLTLSLDQ